MKIAVLATKIIFCIAIHGLLIVYVGLWWNTNVLPSANGIENNLFRAVLAIIVFSAFAVDGYRKYYKTGQKVYFFMSSISPLAISLIGFVYGLYVTYISQN